MPVGIINTASKAISYNNGNDNISYTETISSDIVTGDEVSFDIQGPFAANIQKVVVESESVVKSADKIVCTDKGFLFGIFESEPDVFLIVSVYKEIDENRRCFKEEDFLTLMEHGEWRGFKDLTDSDKIELKRQIDEYTPSPGKEKRIYISKKPYKNTQRTLRVSAVLEDSSYGMNGDLVEVVEGVDNGGVNI